MVVTASSTAPRAAGATILPPQVPTQPGVYVMRDASGAVVYVGKAKNLRQRLRKVSCWPTRSECPGDN